MMTVIVDTRTMMVMDVESGDGLVELKPKEENEFGMPEWDYD